MDFVGGVDFVGGRFTEVGAKKFREKLKKGLKKVARAALIPPGMQRLTRTSGMYDPQGYGRMGLVSGVDFVGNKLTEVGAGKLKAKVKTAMKKVGKGLAKVSKAVVKVAAKVVPAPYNVPFQLASKVADKASSAVQKAKAAKAIKGLGTLAKQGDKKAAATLATLKITADAAKGKPAAGLQLVAAARAKAVQKKAPAKPAAAPARPAARAAAPARAAPARAAPPGAALARAAPRASPRGGRVFSVTVPSGRTFDIEL